MLNIAEHDGLRQPWMWQIESMNWGGKCTKIYEARTNVEIIYHKQFPPQAAVHLSLISTFLLSFPSWIFLSTNGLP